MKLPLPIPFSPMEAKIAAELPAGPEWQYEPKWDGFRCIAFRKGKEVELQSKAGQSLTRYFPEIKAALLSAKASEFVLDGEIILAENGRLAFNQLLQRIHPAASRVTLLSEKTPATLVAFDLLVDPKGASLLELPLERRRTALERFYASYFSQIERIAPSRATRTLTVAQGWLESLRGQLDGVVAKKLDEAYLPGVRAMLKVKVIRSADCVVGGFRYASAKRLVGSLLLGLYEDGLLHHVGFTSSMPLADRKTLTHQLESLIEAPGFSGRAPGGPSRWSTERSAEWQPLRPELVLEVTYDHFSGGRFRHGTRFMRWRPDKAPERCTMKQEEFESKVPIARLITRAAG